MALLLLFIFFAHTFATKAPVCNSVIFSAQYLTCYDILLYEYNIQMNVTVDPSNSKFPNIITLSKISEYSANYGYYFADTPITYSYLRFSDDWSKLGMPLFVWNSTDISYTFNYPNGAGQFDIDIVIGTKRPDIYDNEYRNTFIHNGEIFDNFLPLALPCLQYNPVICGIWDVHVNQSVCCNNFIYVDIPDVENEICEVFQSTTKLKDSTQSIIATLNATYTVDNNFINLNVTDFKSYNLSVNSRYSIGGCIGNNGSPYSSCAYELWGNGDIRYNFLMDYEWIDQNQTINGYYATTAIILRRNGMFLKDDNTLFTSKNPCWQLSAEIPFGNEASFDTSMCCTSFAMPSSTSKSTINPSPSKTPPASCLEYSSMTALSDNSVELKVNYKLNSTGIELNIVDYRGVSNSSAQIEVYSSDSFLLPCKVTVQNSTNQCFYTLSDNKNYELKMRTSIFKDGFNMFSIIENNGKLILPLLESSFPCYAETNPYSNMNSNLTATTSLCCNAFEKV